MGIINKLFGTSGDSGKDSVESKKEDTTPWINLTSIEQLDDIKERSKTKPQFIFKHSTRCGVSRMVISQFKKDYKVAESQADLYYLDLLNYRTISATIAEKFKVTHESPQLLVIKNGAVVAHDSHSAINSLELEKFI